MVRKRNKEGEDRTWINQKYWNTKKDIGRRG
jgi:hypothetical protein